MDADSISKITIIKHSSGNYIKYNVHSSKDLDKKMPVGTFAITEFEAEYLYKVLHAHFNKTKLPTGVIVKDLTVLKRKEAENNRFERDPIEFAGSPQESAADMQRENLAADSTRTPEKKKQEGNTLEEAAQL
jgi:hypothetical protein